MNSVLCSVGPNSTTMHLLQPRRRQRKLSLDLAAVKAIGELDVVSATDPEITWHIPVLVAAREIHTAHVRTMGEDSTKPKA
jgi:hypothetical protein